MELFGLICAAPVAVAVCAGYAWGLAWLAPRLSAHMHTLRRLSLLLLIVAGVEIVGLLTVGAVRLRGTLGPAFTLWHGVAFVSAVPAMMNLLLLRQQPLRPRWGVILFCAAIAGMLLVINIGVDEALYGIDGIGGPYSTHSLP